MTGTCLLLYLLSYFGFYDNTSESCFYFKFLGLRTLFFLVTSFHCRFHAQALHSIRLNHLLCYLFLFRILCLQVIWNYLSGKHWKFVGIHLRVFEIFVRLRGLIKYHQMRWWGYQRESRNGRHLAVLWNWSWILTY